MLGGLGILRQQDMKTPFGETRGGGKRRTVRALHRIGFVAGRERHGEEKARPGALRAFDTDGAAHGLDQAARDAEAETGAAEDARGGDVLLLEDLEEAALRLFGDADAGVLDLDGHRV